MWKFVFGLSSLTHKLESGQSILRYMVLQAGFKSLVVIYEWNCPLEESDHLNSS